MRQPRLTQIHCCGLPRLLLTLIEHEDGRHVELRDNHEILFCCL
jgi:hypothetical protein